MRAAPDGNGTGNKPCCGWKGKHLMALSASDPADSEALAGDSGSAMALPKL